MTRLTRCISILLFTACLGVLPAPAQEDSQEVPDLGKLQQEEILKAEYKQSLQDAGRLVELAQGLKAELEKNGRHVLSVTSLKKAEEIEKLAKRIKNRLRK